jgi:prepilin-type N-terminal cleavage/methylation domain-containing protein/prepilin-type processing-associated H-X9-DG protein
MPGKRGFTLTELLMVVAVVATVVGILFPVFAQARESSRRTVCLSNLRQLALAHQMYVHDYDEILPHWWHLAAGRIVLWPEFLLPYYRDRRLLDQNFSSAVARAEGAWLADYAMVAWGAGGSGTAAFPYFRWPGSYFYSESGVGRAMAVGDVRRPGETLQFTDGVTSRQGSNTLSRHANEVMNGAFLDGHAQRVPKAEYERVDHDERGYFYHFAAADR